MIPVLLGLWGCQPDVVVPPAPTRCDPCGETPVTEMSPETATRRIVAARADVKRPTFAGCVTPTARVVLNEVSPSNREALVDADAESVDWIELYNVDAVPVDLGGWTLTDDPDEPDAWTFPSVTLEPGEHLLVYASGKDRSRVVGSWETRIDRGHRWRYLEVDEEPDQGWFLSGYDDSDWDEGRSGFGRGDSDDATEIDAAVAYVRTELEVDAAELAELTALVLHVDFDDGFVAYLNGVEIAREAMGLADSGPPSWDALAWYRGEAKLPEGLPLPAIEVDPARLVAGTNTLALEVHDRAADSSDMSLVPFLSLGFATARGAGASPLLTLPEVELHTSFKLKSSGEGVALYDAGGCAVDELDWVPLRADESVGRQPDGTGPIGVFLEPTPGRPNTTEARPGFAVTPRIDPPSGLRSGPTTATLTAGSGAEVRVAWGGREPSDADEIYASPIEVGTAEEAVVLRARAWEDGLWPSRIATATWGFAPADPLLTVSVATDPANLWDEQTGIYAEDNVMAGWRRPAHFAAWEPDGSLAFAVDGSVEIHGGSSRKLPQKNLELSVGGGYGDDDAIEHAVYPGHSVTSFERLVLRGGGGDWLGCWTEECKDGAMLRDALMQAIASGTGIDHMGSRPARVYLNGQYWGLYFVNEKGDAHYLDTHHGEDDVDLLKNEGIPVQGDEHGYLGMIAWLRAHDLADPVHYAHAETLIDVDELQSYLALQTFYANTDWPGNNIKFWRPRDAGGRWRWMLFGTDFGLGLKQPRDHDTLAFALATDGDDWPNPPWSTELFRLLAASPEFTATFANRYAALLNTALAPDRTVAELHALAASIEAEIPRQAARWDGDEGAWAPEVASIERWLTHRPDHARENVVEAFGLDGTWTLSLDADPPGSGTFEVEGVAVDGSFDGTWFRGLPVTVTAHPAPGYAFDGWSDPALPAAATVTLDPRSPDVTLTGRFR